MKSIPRLIKRFVSIMLLSSVLLLALNVSLLVLYTRGQMPNAYPWKTAEEVAEALRRDDGGYTLPEELSRQLRQSHVWAVFIDNETMRTVWQTDNLPETVPESYSAADIASLTRGYIDGYPTFTGEAEDGLAVLGYPKDSFWKHMWPSWDYRLISELPKTALSILAVNAALIFLIYLIANSRLLKAVRPIAAGIQSLPAEEAVHIKETGLLAELAVSINKTSDILQSQSRQLRKKENARANWIAGVSHDIRTPLSMVMGYAGQLKEDADLSRDGRQKAAAIIRQSQRMRDLINDLNLASKLEYNMQPLHQQRENLVAIVRQAAADFMNMDIEGRYPLEWRTSETLTMCPVKADRDLLKRAVSNLLQNCMNHNQGGCTILVRVSAEHHTCMVCVDDDGIGVSEEQLETLSHAPHYMACDESGTEQRHGLGLLIVRQIAAVHGGRAEMGKSPQGGFSVKLILPLQK